MAVGWNTRVYNKVDAQAGSDIALSSDGKTIKLSKGTYRVSGFSLTRWIDLEDKWAHPDMDKPPTGYCQLMSSSTGRLTTGSLAVAIYANPSTFDAVVQVADSEDIYVSHQNGKNVTNLWFGLDQTSTHNHVWSRISIFKLD